MIDSRCGAGDLADYFVAIRKWKGPNVTPREGDIVFFNDPCYGRYARGTNIYGASYMPHYVAGHTGIVVSTWAVRGEVFIQTVEGNISSDHAGYSTVGYRTYSLDELQDENRVLGYGFLGSK